MNEKNIWGWVIGIIVILIIIAGIWWWSASSVPAAAPTTTTSVASSTSSVATPALVNNTKISETVAGIVAGLGNDSEYAGFLSSTGVGVNLTGKGPYTVFISTDAGYGLLKPGTISNMTAAQKKRMLQYSIVSGRALNINLQDSGSIKTLSGDELNFSVGPGGVVQVNSSYALQEYKASNGVVYVLNQPILPPTSKNILTP
jgi:uncharacterized surface protein with fasciclin (FAS1) repeats